MDIALGNVPAKGWGPSVFLHFCFARQADRGGVSALPQSTTSSHMEGLWVPGQQQWGQTGWPAAMMNERVSRSQDFRLSLLPTATVGEGPGSAGGRVTPWWSAAGQHLCLFSFSCSVLCLCSFGSSGAKLKNCSVLKRLFD